MIQDKNKILERINSVVRQINPKADVILYGSRARGEEHPDSDWDILILVDNRSDLDYEKVFRHALYDVELEFREAFSITVHNKKEWRLKHWMTPLYKNISKEGITI